MFGSLSWKQRLQAPSRRELLEQGLSWAAGHSRPALWIGSPGAPRKQPGAVSPLPGHLLGASGDQVQAPHWSTQAEMCSHLAAHTGFVTPPGCPSLCWGGQFGDGNPTAGAGSLSWPRRDPAAGSWPSLGPGSPLPPGSVDTSPVKGWGFREEREKQGSFFDVLFSQLGGAGPKYLDPTLKEENSWGFSLSCLLTKGRRGCSRRPGE